MSRFDKPPDNFKSGPPTSTTEEDPVDTPGKWPPKGHLQNAEDEVIEAIWGVPDGLRKGK